jgi:hypothetical protein
MVEVNTMFTRHCKKFIIFHFLLQFLVKHLLGNVNNRSLTMIDFKATKTGSGTVLRIVESKSY